MGWVRLTVAGLEFRIHLLQRSPLLRATKNDRVRSGSDLIGVGAAELKKGGPQTGAVKRARQVGAIINGDERSFEVYRAIVQV